MEMCCILALASLHSGVDKISPLILARVRNTAVSRGEHPDTTTVGFLVLYNPLRSSTPPAQQDHRNQSMDFFQRAETRSNWEGYLKEFTLSVEYDMICTIKSPRRILHCRT